MDRRRLKMHLRNKGSKPMKELWAGIIGMVIIAVVSAVVLGVADSTTAEVFSTASVRL